MKKKKEYRLIHTYIFTQKMLRIILSTLFILMEDLFYACIINSTIYSWIFFYYADVTFVVKKEPRTSIEDITHLYRDERVATSKYISSSIRSIFIANQAFTFILSFGPPSSYLYTGAVEHTIKSIHWWYHR